MSNNPGDYSGENPGENKALKWGGCGCTSVGCFGLLIGLGTVGAVFGGAFNSSIEAQATYGGASAACCGLVAALIGGVLLSMASAAAQPLDR